MPTSRARSVPVSTEPPIPAADFADAFAIESRMTEHMTATEAARRAVAAMPGWATSLLALRNLVVAPLGLKTSHAEVAGDREIIGMFPVVESKLDRIVLGFDDMHLDFRIVVDMGPVQSGARSITATTFVKTHNAFGCAYLSAVLPFHKAIVPAMLDGLA